MTDILKYNLAYDTTKITYKNCLDYDRHTIIYQALLLVCLFAACLERLDIIIVVVSPLVNLERSIYKAGKLVFLL